MDEFYSFCSTAGLNSAEFVPGNVISPVDETLTNRGSPGMGLQPGLVDVLLSGHGELGTEGSVSVDRKSSREKEPPGELAEKPGRQVFLR